MRKSKLWTLAMALAASLGSAVDLDSTEWGRAQSEDGIGLSARTNNPDAPQDGKADSGREPAVRPK